MKLKYLSFSVMTLGACMGVLSSQVLASGYHFGSQSISSQGTAHANGAEANDPTTIFYNPAGLVRLDGTQVSAGVTLVIPNSSYSDQGSVTYAQRPTGGGNGGTFAPSVVAAPSFYLASQVNEKVNVGLGVFVPFGAKLDYGSSWAGRYALNKIELETININPSLALKLNERHSLGLGISAQYMKASLKKSVDVKTGALGLFQMAKDAAQKGDTRLLGYLGQQYGYSIPQMTSPQLQAQMLQRINSLGDGSAQVNANDWGLGFNVGYLYQPNDATRLGIAYRASISQKLNGDATWDYSGVGDPVLARISRYGLLGKPGHDNSNASVDVTTPESLSANIFHQLNSKVALMGDITWTRHSRLKSIDIKFDGTREGDLVVQQYWNNTYKISLGANYQYNDKWMMRAGVAYDQAPVPSDTWRHPALPDSNRTSLSVGANYKVDKKQSLDFAYSYVFFANANVNYQDSCYPGKMNCTGNGERTVGSYKTNLQFVGVQYNYHF